MDLGSTKTASASSENKKDKKEQTVPASAGISVAQKWELPADLREISGLVYLDADRFACVEDENGIVYTYNSKTNEIEKKIVFDGTGDFEGLAMVNGQPWVVQSDGTLNEITEQAGGKAQVKKHKTALTAAHNVEGLCYDKSNDRLLLAIKDDEPSTKDYKGIYAFDLKTKKMAAEPVFKIDLKHELLKSVASKKKAAVMPSSIVVHPTTGDIYITDGPKSTLLIMDKSGTIKQFYQLDENDFSQPEGISFSPNGDLYISNEGSKKAGNILKVTIDKN